MIHETRDPNKSQEDIFLKYQIIRDTQLYNEEFSEIHIKNLSGLQSISFIYQNNSFLFIRYLRFRLLLSEKYIRIRSELEKTIRLLFGQSYRYTPEYDNQNTHIPLIIHNTLSRLFIAYN